MNSQVIILICAAVLVFVSFIVWICSRYRKCPSDKILIVYGNVGAGRSAKCIHGGATFIMPIVQSYAFMDLNPINIDVPLKGALSSQNIRVDVPCRFTVGISTESESMLAAAERLLGLQSSQIQEMARDILFGQLRLVIATMSIEELNSDRDKFLEAITANVEVELKKIGLRLINVNVTDIKDESGYIEALGQEAAAKAINEAKVRVAEQEKVGEIGRAEAVRETRIRTAEANAQAVQGENEAKITIANSDANRREREAEAQRKAIAAEKVAQAQALEEAYAAEQKAEEIKKNNQTEVALAPRQAVAALKEQIASLVVAKSVEPAVHTVTIEPAFVKEMLLGIARGWNGERGELEATLPAALKEQFEADAEGAVKALLAEGVEVGYSERVKSGFKVAPKDGGFYISFTDEDFNALLGEFLKEKIVKMLF